MPGVLTAVDRHLVYVMFLRGCSPGYLRFKGRAAGRVYVGGTVKWERRIGQSESSPVVHKGYVYVGDWAGRVYACREAARAVSVTDG